MVVVSSKKIQHSMTYVSPYAGKMVQDRDFREKFKHGLIDTKEKFYKVLPTIQEAKTLAVDTETTGLSFIDDEICGVSVSTTSYNGWYFPMRHIVGENLPIELYQILVDAFKGKELLFYNATFDLLALKHDKDITLNIDEWIVFDVMSLVFNLDTNIKKNGLKAMSKSLLGREVPTFEEVVGKKMTFNQIPPEKGSYYACCDSSNTFALYKLLSPLATNGGRNNVITPFQIKLDNRLAKAMVFYSENIITIDRKVIEGMEVGILEEKRNLEHEIWKLAGGVPFHIDSKHQLSDVLLSMGIDTGIRTLQGNLKLDEKSLRGIKHPIAQKIILRNSLAKQHSSYIKNLKEDSGRVAYQIYRVPTGRLASGNPKRKAKCFLPINYMNLTKSSPQNYFAHFMDDVFNDEKENIFLGWKFTLLKSREMEKEYEKRDDGYIVEGFNPDRNIRRAITVPDKKNWIFVGADYNQQELRIAAYLSNDKTLMSAYESGEDVHTRTAKQMFGEENYDKSKRKLAKYANFGLLYDGNEQTLHNTTGLPLTECKRIYDLYWQAMIDLKIWKRHKVTECIRNGGVCYTAFGRPRRLIFYIANPYPGLQRFGRRSVCSHIIQGTGGDTMRIILVKMEKEIFKKYPQWIKFIGCVHDELDIAVHKDALDDMLPLVREIMEVKVPPTDLKLPIDFEFGFSYGMIWPFEKTESLWKPIAA